LAISQAVTICLLKTVIALGSKVRKKTGPKYIVPVLREGRKKSMLSGTRIFAMGPLLVALLLVCLADVPDRNTPAVERSTTKVWVNTKSGVYHCPGTRWYGKTKTGTFMEQLAAEQKGYRPAYGKVCDSASTPSASESDAIQNSLGAQCGFERWPVKILTDQDRQLVNFSPVDETVSALNDLKPHGTYPYDRRLKNEELRVYRVRARLIEMHDEADSDLHLIISEPDQQNVTMIAEIPAPFCAIGSGHESDYTAARADVLRIPLGSLVEIEGVGFFDRMHDQRGLARNGFEIHPVLRIRTLE
jgi:hypothetical protein